MCHRLSTDSYLDLVDGRHDSKITLVTSDGSSAYLKASPINELPAVSFSDTRDIAIPCWTVASKHLEEVLLENLEKRHHHRNQNCVTHHGIIMIPTAISLLIFDMEVPIRLNGGKA